MPTLKDLVCNDNMAVMLYYRQGMFYYLVADTSNWDEYVFPIPVSDLGDASLNFQEKALLLMRYIRKAMEDGTLVLRT